MVSSQTARVLARCNGFRVKAGDEVVGAVATPVFSGRNLLPEYLLVRVDDAIPGNFRAVPPELIATADADSETVILQIEASELASLPEPETSHPQSPTTKPPPAPSTEPPAPLGGPGGAKAARETEYDRALRDYRTVARHLITTPLTVIRGAVITLRDFPTLPAEEARKLIDAIERATHHLEQVTLDPLLLNVPGRPPEQRPPTEGSEAGPSVESEGFPAHRAIAMRLAERAAEIASSNSFTRVEAELLERDVEDLRRCAH